jgi:hypothetical protein
MNVYTPPYKAKSLQILSPHAAADEILGCLCHFRTPPKMSFVTQGASPAADALGHPFSEEFGCPWSVPDYRDEAVLS